MGKRGRGTTMAKDEEEEERKLERDIGGGKTEGNKGKKIKIRERCR